MTNIGTNGGKYQTQIPALADNADIQTALRLYHYGATSEPTVLNEFSVAGYLNNLELTKVDIVPTQIGEANNDLNLKATTGYYIVPTTVIASAGLNYPPPAAPGVLNVVNDGSVVYQTYITNTARLYWRARFGGTWTSWKEGADTSFVPTSVGTRLTSLEQAMTGKQAIIEGSLTTAIGVTFGANKVVVTDGSGKIIESTDITTTELGNLNGTTGKAPSLAGTVGGDGTSKKIFIQSTEPTGTSAGDLWFW